MDIADCSNRLRDRAKEVFAKLSPGVRRQILHTLGRYAPWESGFDFSPPLLGRDEEAGPPDFVGIGAQKCGTTWWFNLMMSHPDLYSRDDIHKERHFFDRFGATPFAQSDIAAYAGWFPRRPGTVTGEWTPDYFGLPWVPLLLKSAAPEARIILLLRDPVERFRSGLAHRRRMGEAMGPPTVNDAIQRGFYHRLLEDWLEYFDRGQLSILQYERCVNDPAGELRSTFRFLGLADFDSERFARPASSTPQTAAATSSGDLEPAVRRRLVTMYSADVVNLSTMVPDIDLGLWPNFAHLAGGSTEGVDDPNSPLRRT